MRYYHRRPDYETDENRLDQDNISEMLSEKLNAICVQTSTFASIDFILINKNSHKPKALIEFKRRFVRHKQYETYFISQDKIKKGLLASDLLIIPLLIVVQWDDVVGCLEINKNYKYEIRNGGRMDRNDSKDQEQMMHIPISEFKILHKF